MGERVRLSDDCDLISPPPALPDTQRRKWMSKECPQNRPSADITLHYRILRQQSPSKIQFSLRFYGECKLGPVASPVVLQGDRISMWSRVMVSSGSLFKKFICTCPPMRWFGGQNNRTETHRGESRWRPPMTFFIKSLPIIKGNI